MSTLGPAKPTSRRARAVITAGGRKGDRRAPTLKSSHRRLDEARMHQLKFRFARLGLAACSVAALFEVLGAARRS